MADEPAQKLRDTLEPSVVERLEEQLDQVLAQVHWAQAALDSTTQTRNGVMAHVAAIRTIGSDAVERLEREFWPPRLIDDFESDRQAKFVRDQVLEARDFGAEHRRHFQTGVVLTAIDYINEQKARGILSEKEHAAAVELLMVRP